MSFGRIEVSERELHYELLSTTLENASHLRGLGAVIAARRWGGEAVRRAEPTGAGQTRPGSGAAKGDFRHDRSSAVVAVSIQPIQLLADCAGAGSEPGRPRPPLHFLVRADDHVAGSNHSLGGWTGSGVLPKAFATSKRGLSWPFALVNLPASRSPGPGSCDRLGGDRRQRHERLRRVPGGASTRARGAQGIGSRCLPGRFLLGKRAAFGASAGTIDASLRVLG